MQGEMRVHLSLSLWQLLLHYHITLCDRWTTAVAPLGPQLARGLPRRFVAVLTLVCGHSKWVTVLLGDVVRA